MAYSANLGDSGFLVFTISSRAAESGHAGGGEYEVKFRTNQMEHEFGCPFQLGHHSGASRYEEADLASFTIKKGDIIVMGSDGLLDNLSESEMLAEINRPETRGAQVREGGGQGNNTPLGLGVKG